MTSPVLIVAATEAELCRHDGLVCGVGPVEAAATTARDLALRDGVAALLHVGLAGASGLPAGSFVVGSHSVYADVSAEWPVVDRVEPDARLVEAVLDALSGAALLPIVTSAAVAGPCNTVSAGLTVVEAMEGFGVLRAASLAGLPAVEVRVISNELGEEDRARWAIEPALEALGRALPVMVERIARAHEGFGSRLRRT
jgi:futalosine hydrolase